jgi:hypothetical protein
MSIMSGEAPEMPIHRKHNNQQLSDRRRWRSETIKATPT